MKGEANCNEYYSRNDETFIKSDRNTFGRDPKYS